MARVARKANLSFHKPVETYYFHRRNMGSSVVGALLITIWLVLVQGMGYFVGNKILNDPTCKLSDELVELNTGILGIVIWLGLIFIGVVVLIFALA